MTVLKSNGIAYDAVDIEHDPAAAEFVGSVNGGNQTVPTREVRRRVDADQPECGRGESQAGRGRRLSQSRRARQIS